jgi:hypothetical protein
MKTALVSVYTAILLGFVSLASGRHLDAADFMAILFTVGLVAWTVSQYTRQPRPLLVVHPVNQPAPRQVRASVVTGQRLAA